ncbi:MAG TPA: hypothetical protein VLZ33_01450 [Dysgonamonadaceae bacterium]|nr:hypothetical protein [Dysgonamonadaceae bacterium]
MKFKLNKIENILLLFSLLLTIGGCSKNPTSTPVEEVNGKGQPVYIDKPYIQEYSVRYYLTDEQPAKELIGLSADRDWHIHILSEKGVLVPDNGRLFYPGKLIPDIAYTPMIPRKIKALLTYKKHTVYLDNKQVFSNAWAGKLQIDHGLSDANYFAASEDFHFLVSDGEKLVYFDQYGKKLWTNTFPELKQIIYHSSQNHFVLVSANQVALCSEKGEIQALYDGTGITCAAPLKNSEKVLVGTSNGYLILPNKKLIDKVPCTHITCASEINGELWLGSIQGAFRLNDNGKYSYFAGERWLPGNKVISIQKGKDNSILVLTNKGLGQIFSKEMTLEEKALFFEKQVREKNIRYGFNCSVSQLPEGYSSAQMGTQPSDNLWTGMYLASQLYRYKVTGSEEAKENAYEAFEAMERLHTITGIKGLYARSFERDYKVITTKSKDWEKKELISGSPATLWLSGSDHSNWTWRSAVSSDQTVGQMFALTMILELVDDSLWKQRALKLMDDMMSYIVDNDMYIIDVDGKPTLWGKWNPEYVNKFPENVGDRRLYSSNIIAFLQTAWHFTKKEKYKDAAYELMDKYGYLENLTRPISEIGPTNADELSKILSHEWNHSDDEMYFLAYWGLYPYAFTPELQKQYLSAIHDHWDIERPERNALWNFTYAMTGAKQFDLNESIGFLQQYPLDLRNWSVHNSDRKDIKLLPDNFRNQSTKTLLPLEEIPLYRHNGEIFKLDSNGEGNALISAGDVWLLPYWMGRYLDVISAPVKNTVQNENTLNR